MAQITSEHYASVYRFCYRQLGPDRASDAAQETFLNAQRRISSYNGTSSMRTWLFGIALNCCRNMMRKHRMEANYEHLWNEKAQGINETGLVNRQALVASLKQLPNELLEVVILKEVEGMTYDEVASALGIPSGTVKSRLHTAFVRLREALTAEITK